ncbi:TIGR04086 family membrane protein [Staphylospora marina]|uniref:TIGR04086 family membrane protein n=1 Tax=Staphylospora marina TaxID=2490858 RepID=UPI0013DE24C8|nr:TIGR04086 family membrane protein [Staphylospora marina]
MKETFLEWGKRGLSSPWLTGQLWLWGLILAGSFTAALLLRYSSLDSSSLPTIAYSVNALSLFAAGFAAARKARSRGWIHGGTQGLIYAATILLISFLAFDARPTLHPFVLIASSFGTGALGGMLGVNTGSRFR